MIRVANPGSDIATLIHIFRVLHTYLRDKPWFGLDDISATLTQMNLAASSGYVGEQALVLSTKRQEFAIHFTINRRCMRNYFGY